MVSLPDFCFFHERSLLKIVAIQLFIRLLERPCFNCKRRADLLEKKDLDESCIVYFQLNETKEDDFRSYFYTCDNDRLTNFICLEYCYQI